MKNTDLLCKVISLLGMAVILAIAWGMDVYLTHQKELAEETMKYLPFFGLIAASALLLIALWFGLGWLVLFKCGYSRLIWITFLAVGFFCTLFIHIAPSLNWLRYITPSLPWSYIWANIINTLFTRSAMVRSTGMFIAVLGLLNLTLRSRSK